MLWRNPALGSRLRQCWFLGCHSDVGGQKTKSSGIADVTLVWMVGCLGEVGVPINTEALLNDLRGPKKGDSYKAMCKHDR